MDFFQNSLLPFTVAFVFIYGIIKKQAVFSVFTEGAKTALKQTAELLPVLTALSVAVAMFNSSGMSDLLCKLLAPLSDLFHIPSEVLPLCLISPLSGSGSLAVLENILSAHSPDSYAGRVASVIAGASETTFYAIAVYFGGTGITKTRHTLPSALTADFVSFIAASFFCRLF